MRGGVNAGLDRADVDTGAARDGPAKAKRKWYIARPTCRAGDQRTGNVNEFR